MATSRSAKRGLADAKESPPKKLKTNQSNTFYDKYNTIIKEKYGVELPQDFYLFFEFIQDKEVSSVLSSFGLHLTGPFDILEGNIKEDRTQCDLHLHGRHYYDIPEIMTVLYVKNNSGFHIGYFRDDPKQLPTMLVSNKSEVNGEFTPCGDNIFAPVYTFCQSFLIKASKDEKKVKVVTQLLKKIEKRSKELHYSLEAVPPSVKKRQKSINSKTFNKIGIVVPMDKTGVGYRELPSTDRELKQILTKIVKADTEEKKNNAFDELDEIITLVQFANDECDYGMGLELGIDLFTFGSDAIKGPISHLLPLAYQLLGRDLYSDVITAHMEDRKRHGFISKI